MGFPEDLLFMRTASPILLRSGDTARLQLNWLHDLLVSIFRMAPNPANVTGSGYFAMNLYGGKRQTSNGLLQIGMMPLAKNPPHAHFVFIRQQSSSQHQVRDGQQCCYSLSWRRRLHNTIKQAGALAGSDTQGHGDQNPFLLCTSIRHID